MSDDQECMLASVCTEYGPANEVFQMQKVKKPKLTGPNQMLVANYGTSVNPADCKQRSGNLKLVMSHKFPLILGQDFAGKVVEVGDQVTKFQIGDSIFGSTAPRNSCSAEYVLVEEHEAALKPTNISWEEAAAAPTGYCTAWRGLFDKDYGNLPQHPSSSSRTVLIVGASGSVGNAAVQLAIHVAKVEVYGICGSKNMSIVKSMGVKKVLDYKSDNYLERIKGKTFDLILDCVGGDEYYCSLHLFLKPKTGKYITCVGPVLHGGSKPITTRTLLQTICTLVPRFVGNYFPGRWNSRYKMYLSFTTVGALDGVAQALKDKAIKPRIDPMSPISLEKLGEAHQKVETGHSDGKVVVKITNETTAK